MAKPKASMYIKIKIALVVAGPEGTHDCENVTHLRRAYLKLAKSASGRAEMLYMTAAIQ